jgi:hypothetical protein
MTKKKLSNIPIGIRAEEALKRLSQVFGYEEAA